MNSAAVASLAIYPVKSLDPMPVETATLLPSGALAGDRRFALVDETDDFVNGKRERRVHTIRTRYRDNATSGLLWFGSSPEPEGDAVAFDLVEHPATFAERISPHLGYRVSLVENEEQGFPDDTDASGPTIISRETLLALSELMDVPVEELRRRFRANVELTGGGAFFEDRAFGPAGTVVPLRIGAAMLLGVNPCRRCAVPGRDSWTGETHPGFAKRLSTWREATLGEGVARERFDGNWYRLALNTRPLPGAESQSISVGDSFEIVGPPMLADEAFQSTIETERLP
ncbi:MAG TPA: MOSC N-terminal beta barrel domain-containing protein [Pirellulaceae bacterium]|jgi:hypothetical protein|nr:MOSC N-terminal beta barrel domain-containing protein [Pirellulaceae bacterium]